MKKISEKGFTLIELLIVIGIIAILAGAVIIAINPGQQFQQARNATRWSHMNSLMNAVYSYAVTEQGNFPGCLTDGSPEDASECEADLVTGGFINEIPQDPQSPDTDSCYQIELDGNLITIDIKTTVPCDTITDDVSEISISQ